MKNQKGITLNSLVIYVLGMTIVVSIIASLTSFIMKNVQDKNNISQSTTQYTKFSSRFIKEINTNNNTVIDCQTNGSGSNKISYIVFSSGNQYTFQNNCIYKNNVKICDNVQNCEFSCEYDEENLQHEISIDFKTEIVDMTGTNSLTYSL